LQRKIPAESGDFIVWKTVDGFMSSFLSICLRLDIFALQNRYTAAPFDMLPKRREHAPALHARRAYRVRQHISSAKRISQIPPGIYIAANKKSPGSLREILLLAISP